MDDKLELWTVTTFDDAAALIALPPHERWVPADRRQRSSAPLAALAAALVVFVFGAAVWLVADGRLVPAAPSAKPAPSNVIRLAPGGPFDEEQTLPPEIKANLEAAYGLDQPLLTQYAHYVGALLRGDFGMSLRYRDFTVGELIEGSTAMTLSSTPGPQLSLTRTRPRASSTPWSSVCSWCMACRLAGSS